MVLNAGCSDQQPREELYPVHGERIPGSGPLLYFDSCAALTACIPDCRLALTECVFCVQLWRLSNLTDVPPRANLIFKASTLLSSSIPSRHWFFGRCFVRSTSMRCSQDKQLDAKLKSMMQPSLQVLTGFAFDPINGCWSDFVTSLSHSGKARTRRSGSRIGVRKRRPLRPVCMHPIPCCPSRSMSSFSSLSSRTHSCIPMRRSDAALLSLVRVRCVCTAKAKAKGGAPSSEDVIAYVRSVHLRLLR